MNEQIKQRITQLNNGEVPSGYEKTDFGIFPCDWIKNKTFGDLFDFYGGLGKSREELGEEGHAYLHYGDLHRGSFNLVSHEQYEHLSKYDVTLKGSETYLMEDGDVAFLDASEDLEGTSRSVLIDNPDNEPFIAGLHIIFGKSKDNSLEKWYKQYITTSESVRKQFQRLAAGFKVYGVNRDTLPRIQVAYPKSTEEQSKIAEILMKWDEAIELYNQLIEKLKQLKSVCLKKMFPQRGEKVPEWRFKGFTDAWEQRKLSEMCGTFEYGLNAAAKEFDGQNKYIRITDIDDASREFLLSDLSSPDISLDGMSKYLLSRGDIVFARTGASVGKTYIYKENDGVVYFAGFLIRAKVNQSNDAEFVFQSTLSPSYERYIRITSQRSGQPGVNAQEYGEYDLLAPSKEEQQRIGQFLRGIDDLITLHQCKVEKIKAQQRVLQKYLLNGIVRV